MERALRKSLKHGRFCDVPRSTSGRMSAIRSRGNRTTELTLRGSLVRGAVRGWVLHPGNLPGNPDFLFEQSSLAVFVDGCFWHGCPKCSHRIGTNSLYWNTKIARNIARDKTVKLELRKLGFKVMRIWEHELIENASDCVKRIRQVVRSAHLNA